MIAAAIWPLALASQALPVAPPPKQALLDLSAPELAELDPANPRYRDCQPPENLAKRLPSTTLEQAVSRSTSYLTYDRPGPLARENPVTGALANSDKVYAKLSFGIPIYGKGHTYASVSQPLDGPKQFSIHVSSTNYSTGSKILILNDIAEIFISIGGKTRAVTLTSASEQGWCSAAGQGQLDNCFSTATANFTVDEDLFQALASGRADEAILVPAKLHSGEFRACPLYFAPLSFKAPLQLIDTQVAKAAKKRAKQRAKG